MRNALNVPICDGTIRVSCSLLLFASTGYTHTPHTTRHSTPRSCDPVRVACEHLCPAAYRAISMLRSMITVIRTNMYMNAGPITDALE